MLNACHLGSRSTDQANCRLLFFNFSGNVRCFIRLVTYSHCWFFSPCCQLPYHSSRSVLASPCSVGSGVVCSPIQNNSSEEHLAVSFTLLTTRPHLMMMTLPFFYLSGAEFNALHELAQKTLPRPTFTTNLTTCSTTNPPNNPVVASDTTSANPNRIYPIVTAPVY